MSRIDFEIISKEMSFELVSNFTYEEAVVLEMKNRYDLQVAGQRQLTGIEYFKEQNEFLTIKVQLQEAITQARVEFISKQPQAENIYYDFQIIVNGWYQNPHQENSTGISVNQTDQLQIIVQPIIQNQQKSEEIHPIFESIGKFIKYLKQLIELTACSYFILNLIGFWSVSLLYIFLQIHIVPQPVRQIYQKFIQIFFQDATILKVLRLVFQVPNGQTKVSGEDQIRQLIPLSLSDLSWFGQYGISSKIITNNLETIFMLSLLTAKIIVFRIIIMVVKKKLYSKSKVSFNFSLILLAEFISAVSLIIVSAGTCIKNSMVTFFETLQKAIQVLLFFCSVVSFAVLTSFVLKIKNKVRFKWSSQQKKTTKYKQVYKRKKAQENVEFGFYQDEAIANLHILLVPMLLILFQNYVFFAIIFVFIVARIIYYFRVNQINCYERVHLIIMNIIWLLHHCGFLSFLILSKLKQKDYFTEEVPYVNEICLLVTLTVIVGGLMEILMIVIQLLVFIITLLKEQCQRKVCIVHPEQNKIAKKDESKKSRFIIVEEIQFVGNSFLSVPIETMKK